MQDWTICTELYQQTHEEKKELKLLTSKVPHRCKTLLPNTKMTSFPGFSLNLPTQVDTTYNGWTNYETWNVSLYINNEYGMYMTALDWVKDRQWDKQSVDYDVFRHTLTELFGDKTPDGVSWSDNKLDHEELSEMLLELVD